MAVQTKMTAAEFLQLPETNEHIELIDGEIVVSSPKASHRKPLLSQQNISKKLPQMG
jgi:hypothetical protein